MDAFIVERERMARVIDSIQAKVGTMAAALAPMYIQELKQIVIDLRSNVSDIVKTCAKTQRDKNTDEYTKLKDQAYELIADLEKLLPAATSTAQPAAAPTSAVPRLPEIGVPKFNGEEHLWPAFRLRFSSMITKHTSLSDEDQLHYLLEALQGRARSVIASIIPGSGTTFAKAWQILESRYQNTRHIVYNTVRKLCNFSNCTSPEEIERLIDTTRQCLATFSLMKLDPGKADFLLLPILLDKLPNAYTEAFEAVHKGDELKSVEDMLEFMQSRAQSQLFIDKRKKVAPPFQKFTPHQSTSVPTRGRSPPTGNSKPMSFVCVFCRQGHKNIYCPLLTKEPDLQKRWSLVIKHKVCANCLQAGHISSKCERPACKSCQKMHHALLHRDVKVASQTTEKVNTANMETAMLLATAIVQVRHKLGYYIKLRAVVDPGATVSVISENARQQLSLRGKPANIKIQGIGGKKTSAGKRVPIHLASCVSDFETKIEPVVMKRVGIQCPSFDLEGNWEELKDLRLADPSFYRSSHVDLLLGQDVYHQLILPEIRRHKKSPMALNSELGWLLQGPVPLDHSRRVNVVLNVTEAEVPDLTKYWELEELPKAVCWTPVEQEVEHLFSSTTEILSTGQYQVRLPLADTVDQLGDSKQVATARQLGLERKFAKNDEYRQLYTATMQEYMDHGYLVPASSDIGVHLPHHGVVSKASGKLRVVFDASATTTSGLSLNDVMLLGPKTQPDLMEILLRFRLRQVAISLDIEKMYMRILVHPEHRYLQRIVWRTNPLQSLEEYELATVTWGTKAAPYLATRVLKDIGERIAEDHPEVARVILEDFYMDDGLTGANTAEEARQLISELQHQLGKAGFHLHKWATNEREVLQGSENMVSEVDIGDASTALGIKWDTELDTFSFRTSKLICSDKRVTKRSIMSEAGRIFDPMGWASPVMLKAKLLIQDLWKDRSYNWDTPLPETTRERWKSIKEQCQELDTLQIPRKVLLPNPKGISICAFADSSERAYACAVYLRSEYQDGTIQVSLLASKTKLAPTKPCTLPRLELCAAVLLAKTVVLIRDALHIDHLSVFAFTDSTVALGWISSHPSRWKTFISNRVGEIQSRIPSSQWRHCRSEDNCADFASRGGTTEELRSHHLWWQGPEWLYLPSFNRPTPVAMVPLPEEKPPLVLSSQLQEKWDLLTRFSSPVKLFRITAYVLRFIALLRRRIRHPVPSHLQPSEIVDARRLVIRLEQEFHYGKELKAIQAKKSVAKDSVLFKYAPYLDTEGILRIGGRLKNADLPINQIHPIVLARASHFTEILIRDLHWENLHAGPHLLITIVHRNYFIPGCRNLVRRLCRLCVPCAKMKARTETQMMADLPKPRVTPSPPFTHCGVDLGGPYTLRTHLARSTRHYKSYICLFVCFATRAVHIELLSSLSAECFIAGFTRFTSRRMTPSVMYSDQGTNFTAASKALLELQEDVSVKDYFANHNIAWKFNPPSAPHWGGLWEAGIKSAKYHLAHLLKDHVLNFEEMTTVLCKVEAVLNSRPLTETDDTSLEALTPAHFLSGGPLKGHAEPNLLSEEPLPRQRWRLVVKITQHFWTRWSSEYLSRLQQRPKWCKPQPNVQVGQLVLIKDDNQPSLRWKLARVEKVLPDDANVVRAVVLRTASGTLTRPIVKIACLPLSSFSRGQAVGQSALDATVN